MQRERTNCDGLDVEPVGDEDLGEKYGRLRLKPEELETLPHETLLNPYNWKNDQKHFVAYEVQDLLRTKARLLGLPMSTPPPPCPGSFEDRLRRNGVPAVIDHEYIPPHDASPEDPLPELII